MTNKCGWWDLDDELGYVRCENETDYFTNCNFQDITVCAEHACRCSSISKPTIKMTKIKWRAETPAKKKEVAQRLLSAWLAAPEQRLGQMLANALRQKEDIASLDLQLFYIEDEKLAETVENFINQYAKPKKEK